MIHVMMIRMDRLLKDGGAETFSTVSGKKAMKHDWRSTSSTKERRSYMERQNPHA